MSLVLLAGTVSSSRSPTDLRLLVTEVTARARRWAAKLDAQGTYRLTLGDAPDFFDSPTLVVPLVVRVLHGNHVVGPPADRDRRRRAAVAPALTVAPVDRRRAESAVGCAIRHETC